MAWRPSLQRQADIDSLGPTAARRAARRRRQAAAEAAVGRAGAGGGPGSWRDRELASRPALQCAASGRRIPGSSRRRRNAAWHAARVPPGGFAAASSSGIAWAAAGPRLGWHPESGQQCGGAAPRPQAGLRCTCGNVVFSSALFMGTADWDGDVKSGHLGSDGFRGVSLGDPPAEGEEVLSAAAVPAAADSCLLGQPPGDPARADEFGAHVVSCAQLEVEVASEIFPSGRGACFAGMRSEDSIDGIDGGVHSAGGVAADIYPGRLVERPSDAPASLAVEFGAHVVSDVQLAADVSLVEVPSGRGHIEVGTRSTDFYDVDAGPSSACGSSFSATC